MLCIHLCSGYQEVWKPAVSADHAEVPLHLLYALKKKAFLLLSDTNGFHIRSRPAITSLSGDFKHILALNVPDPFFRERIMSHGHHFSIRM